MSRPALLGLVALLLFTGGGVTVSMARPAGASKQHPSGQSDWELAYWRQRHLADDLQARLTRRVLEVRALRRTLAHKQSSLEALRLTSVVYHVPFDLLYRRASCESTGDRPASPPSERTLDARARNASPVWNGEHATGLLQFLPSTFASTPFAGMDIYSPYANALAAGWMIGVAGRSNEWACR